MEDQEEQRQWLEDVKNSYAVEWMDKDKALRLETKPDPKGELKSISSINMTHPKFGGSLRQDQLESHQSKGKFGHP